MRRFDMVITVDWSAASTPTLGRDSIWLSIVPDGVVMNIATRCEAAHVIEHLITNAAGRCVLLACDFSFGYPAGTAASLGLPDPQPWLAIWALLDELVVDQPNNRNNRFDVAARLNEQMGERRFWGVPRAAASTWLSTTKPPIARPFRRVELAYREIGRRPASSWQLLGAGSVGGQSLTGIPHLHRLRRSLPQRVTVWPFEAMKDTPDEVVIAEVWPSELAREMIDAVEHPIRDARQVIALGDVLGRGASFTHPGGDATTDEGWVLSTIGI